MFRAFFNWLNSKQREKYLSMPRVMPQLTSYALQNIVLSQEYADPDNPAIRKSIIAWQDEGGLAMTEYKVDLSSPDKKVQVVDRHAESSPEDTIKYMLAFEEKCHDAGMLCAKHLTSKNNYNTFAHLHGLHVTDDNKVIKVDSKNLPVNRASLDRQAINVLFAKDQSQIHSWADFHRVLNQMVMTRIDQKREAVLMYDVLNLYAEWQEKRIAEMPELVKDLKRLWFSGARECMVHRGEDVSNFGSSMRLLSHSTSLIGLTRAGAQVFADYVANGMKPSDAQQVRHSKIYISRQALELGFNEQQADQIGDLIVKGPDPTAPDYPVRKILQDLIAERAERKRIAAEQRRIAEEKRIQGLREAAEAFMRPVKVQPLLRQSMQANGAFDRKVSFWTKEKFEPFTLRLKAKFLVEKNSSLEYNNDGFHLKVSCSSACANVCVFEEGLIVINKEHVIQGKGIVVGMEEVISGYKCSVSVSDSGLDVHVGTLTKERYLGIEPVPQRRYFSIP